MHPASLVVITRPDSPSAEEAAWIATLLSGGVGRVHIRKPGASAEELRPLLEAIPHDLRRRCYLSHHLSLVKAYALGGVHLSVADWKTCAARPEELAPWQEVGVSVHSEAELAALPFRPDYAYLSPVAPSLSKPGYGETARWSKEELRQLPATAPCRLIALGGVTPANASRLLQLGFHAVASLGFFASLDLSQLTEALRSFCQPRVLLCGGIDPTAEAGLTADVRHAERLGAKAYTLATALTSQDASTFYGLKPVTDAVLSDQLCALSQLPPPAVAKIGLVTSVEQALSLVRQIRALFPSCLLLWDPIFRTSSGHDLLPAAPSEALTELCRSVDYLLPNAYEQAVLFGETTPATLAHDWQTVLLCKSHRRSETAVTDVAYLPEGGELASSVALGGSDRHGTGCLYATELAVALAEGASLEQAMGRSQRAVTHYRLGRKLLPRPAKTRLGRRMFITHAPTGRQILEQTHAVLSRGLADIVQLRMKEADEASFLATAASLLVLCHTYGVPLIINDRVEVARLVGADGVHLGPDDLSPEEARRQLGPEVLIGLTCHNRRELTAALRAPIDYVGLGPYRYTKTKKKLAPVLGLEGYYQLELHTYPLPVYAIGGIHLDEEARLLDTGVYGIALSGGLVRLLAPTDELTDLISPTHPDYPLC